MKIALALSAIALGALLPLQGAAASDQAVEAALTMASQGQDLSAAKKKKRRYVHVYPSHDGYYYPPAFAPGDPSWQSPDMIRRRAIGECIIDLGYGRWESCSNAGRGGR